MTLPTLTRVALPATLALLLTVPTAHADPLVDNLAQPIRATTIVFDNLWAAQSFVTASDPVRLLSIEIPIGLSEGGPAIVAELHSGAGPTQIGATLATFMLPVVSAGAPQIESLLALPAFDLTPDTTYWIVLGVVGAGSFGWSYAANNIVDGPGTLGNYAYSEDGGGSWSSFSDFQPYSIRVNVATAVPEPGTTALIGAGLLCIAALHRRRQRRG